MLSRPPRHRPAHEVGHGVRGAEDRGPDLGDRERRFRRHDQGVRPRHLGRGHGRPRQVAIGAPEDRGIDAGSRSRQVHRLGPVVRRQRQLIGGRTRGDGDDVGDVVAAGVAGNHVVVGSRIAGRGYEADADVVHGHDRIPHHHRGAQARPPRVVRDHDVGLEITPHHRDIGHRGQCGRDGTEAVVTDDLQRQERHLPVHTRDADPIVAHGPDDSRDVRPVTETVLHVVGVADEVPALHVVDEPIPLVVDAVAGNLPGISPDIAGQVGMREVDARVEDRDDHAPHPDAGGPGRAGPDERRGPLQGIPRVVRDGLGFDGRRVRRG